MTQFAITESEHFYTVEGIKLPLGGFGAIQITEQLLDGGVPHTQSDWTEYRERTGYGPGSGPLQYLLHSTLYDNRDENGVEELRWLLANDFKKYYIATSSRIFYRAKGVDAVTHNIGTPEKSSLDTCLVGSMGYVEDVPGNVTQALLGSDDANKIMSVYQWMTGRKPYIWRLVDTPKQDEQRVLVIGNDPYGDLGINAKVGIDNDD